MIRNVRVSGDARSTRNPSGAVVITTAEPSRRKNCVILVLVSAPYDEANDLRDYGTFRAHVGQAERR